MNSLGKNALDNINLSAAIFRSNISSLISIYEDSLNIRESRIKELDNRLESWSKENTGKLPKEIEELEGDWFQDYNHYMHHFDYLLLHSLFISSFSLFENHLKRVVEVLVQGTRPNIKPSDMKGNGEIDTLRKYLNLVFNLNSTCSDMVEWAEIIEYKAIRNALVHAGGMLNKKKKSNLNKVKGFKKIKEHNVWYRTDSIYFRIKNIDFINGFHRASVNFSDKIVQEINQLYSPKNITS